VEAIEMSVKPVRKPVGKAKQGSLKPSKKSPDGKKVKVPTKDGTVTSEVVDRLPAEPRKGHLYTTEKYNGKLKKKVRTTFEATGKTGFGKYKIRRTEHLE
jgi:hypothetical protein